MKSLHTFLDIPTPCHQNWDAMSEAEQGRYCQVCAKTVIDFSLMSNEDILQYLNTNTGKVCGRFEKKQLQPHRTLSPKLKVFFYALCSLFLLLKSENLFAQKTEHSIVKDTVMFYKIYGRVEDENRQALIGATLQLFEKASLIGRANTDTNGNYSIFPVRKGATASIKVWYAGMNPEEIKDIPVTNKDRKVEIQMEKKYFGKDKRKMVTNIVPLRKGTRFNREVCNQIPKKTPYYGKFMQVSNLQEMIKIMDTDRFLTHW